MDIRYVAPCFDSSGYSEAARNNIVALTRAGVNVLPKPISFEKQYTNLGEKGELVTSLIEKNKLLNPKVQIIHCTPENYSQYIQKGCYNIGYAAWETSKLPANWAKYFNTLNEVWVPSTYNVKVFRDSGVTVPVTLIPHPFSEDTNSAAPIIKKVNNEYIFYSIFQWLERKNPIGLLKAYLTEFTAADNVVLIMKTFQFSHNNSIEVERIKETIKGIKDKLYLSSYPRVLLITDLLSSSQMKGLHRSSDCYVHLHRSEGFGIPVAEAMFEGKPVITTNYGGVTDFVTNNETGYLIDSTEIPVYGMPWPIYTGDMIWAEPDILHARKVMREVFTNQEAAALVGKRGQQYVKDNLSFEKVGQLMKDRLEKIA